MSHRVLLHGIPGCDTVKKARKWLDDKGVDYQFVNFKKDGIDASHVSRWIEQVGLEAVLNKRGTTWRKLDPERQSFKNDREAIELICQQPSLVKRPVLVNGETLQIGFKPELYEILFKSS